ncbi:MAG: HigA family addiction module antitoxin [Nitrosospira sp.]|nr:HigA family addiction module antitoxin [Nitrosospira sp.]
MSAVQGIRMKSPAHPGGFVRTEIIEPLGLSVTGAAQALGVTRPALSAFLNERASLSSEMALRIEKAFGVSMATLMRMQNSFEIAQARKREKDIKVSPFHPKPGNPPRSEI